jgi:predicted transcriptional regulator
MMHSMRTTVDLPNITAARVDALAKRQKRSKSATLAELVRVGLDHVDSPSSVRVDPVTGLAVFSFGHQVTSEEVADVIDEDL